MVLSRSARLLLGAFATALPVGAAHGGLQASAQLDEDLARTGRAFCIVALRAEQDPRASGVASVQQAVLENVGEAHFVLAYRYDHVAALAGRVDAEGLQRLRRDPLVVAVGPDASGRAHTDSSAPAVGADVARRLGADGTGATVVLLDSGVEVGDIDLASSLAPGAFHFLGQGSDVGPGAVDENGHGTHLAGVITGDGLLAPLGLAPEAAVLAVRVLDANGNGFVSDWIAGIDYVVGLAANDPSLCAINLSLGTTATFSECPCDSASSANLALESALAAARSAGILAFASSGNAGHADEMSSPACLGSAIAVASTYEADTGPEPDVLFYSTFFGPSFATCADPATEADRIACFSNLSPCNDLAAPGRNVTSSSLGATTFSATGTSVSTAEVTAVAAALMGATRAAADDVATALHATGAPASGVFGPGVPAPRRIDGGLALAALSPFEQACQGSRTSCTPCPCGNGAPFPSVGGCAHAGGDGGVLRARGLPSLAHDSLRFELGTLPGETTALLFSADLALPSNPANPCFGANSGLASGGDGLRCVGGALRRHGTRASDLEGELGTTTNGWGPPSGPSGGILAQAGFGAGQVRWFQAFYRTNPQTACGNGMNTSQAVGVVIVP